MPDGQLLPSSLDANAPFLRVPRAHPEELRAYVEALGRAGIGAEQLRLPPRGVDHELFHPGRRRPEMWRDYGLHGACRFPYVFRVSKETNLDVLLAAFEALRQRGRDADLIVVGDGPYLEELAARHTDLAPSRAWRMAWERASAALLR